MPNKSALLIIDAQVNMFDETFPVYQADETLSKLETLTQQARMAGVPLIFVRHDGGKGEVDEFGTEGWQVHPRLAPRKSDIFVEKKQPSAFENTQLQEVLQGHSVSRLIIAGMQTDYCVNATTRQAMSLGYDVTLVADGHSTFDSDDKTAPEIISEYNSALAGFAKLTTVEDIQF